MSLFGTADGCFMNFAYDWAFTKPVRTVYYNLTITGLPVFVVTWIVALGIWRFGRVEQKWEAGQPDGTARDTP
jgi:nickel/cobalt transporter (NiCoT) family protein